jgi:4-hydroxybenzoate polyprenyltransferase
MTKILRAVWDEFLYGGHLQCLGSVAILWTAADLFRLPFPWGLPLSTYAVSYAVYIYNRLLEVKADEVTNPARTAYVVQHRRPLWRAFVVSSLLAAVVVLATASVSGAIFLGVVFACGLLYTNSLKALTRIIPGFKTLYVAVAFTALVFLPFLYIGRKIPFDALLPFAGWAFLNAVIMQVFLDVKDMASDQRAGLRTIPLLLGKKTTFRVLSLLTILAALAPLVWGSRLHFPPGNILLAIAPLLSLVAFRMAEKGAYQGYLLESGKFISWPVLLALGRVLLA